MISGQTLRLSGRLFQQYIVDAFAAIEQERLYYIRTHQTQLRTELYETIRDAVCRGDTDANGVGKGIILPASFTGSRRYMAQYFHDSLAICQTIGHPHIFLTMTCNPKWDEVTRMMSHLPSFLRPEDCPDITARVFRMKLDQLLEVIRKKNFFGRCIGGMCVYIYLIFINVITCATTYIEIYISC